MIGFDHEQEALRQADGIDDIYSRARRREASDRAIDAAAVAKRQHAVFEHPMPGCYPLFSHCLVHRHGPHIAICFVQIS